MAQSLVLPIDVCPELGIPPLQHLAEFFSGRSWPKIGPGMIFFGGFENIETFFSKICAHSERYRNLLAGIFKILTFYGNIALPLSPVLQHAALGTSSVGYLRCSRYVRSAVRTVIDAEGTIVRYVNTSVSVIR